MWQYRILKPGFFHADGGAMFGAIPKRVWKRNYPSDASNNCILAMNCLLVWNDERIILVDTGVGTKDLGRLSSYHFYDTENITDAVQREGFEPEQVTDVFLSHLHFDHCGGCSYTDENGNPKVAFPNAKHWVSENQYANYLHPNKLEKSAYRPADFLPAVEKNLMALIRDNSELYSGFQVSIHNGHTPGQLVVSFETSTGTILFPGDVIPTRAHWADAWISAYDTHPLDSLNAKIELKKQYIKKENTSVVFYHDAYTNIYNYSIKK
jgi:glyoxylase-like metal-dependent hydrolase (beta-lactamase superfamily II)